MEEAHKILDFWTVQPILKDLEILLYLLYF